MEEMGRVMGTRWADGAEGLGYGVAPTSLGLSLRTSPLESQAVSPDGVWADAAPPLPWGMRKQTFREDMGLTRATWAGPGHLRNSRPLLVPQNQVTSFVCLTFLEARVEGLKGRRTPPQGGQGSRWSHGRVRKKEGAGPRRLSPCSSWALVGLR